MAKQNDKKIATKSRKQIKERRVKVLLAERGWTQEDLAREAGINPPYLNRIIRNQRYVERHVDKIAAALGVSTRRILESVPSLSSPIPNHQSGDETTALVASTQE